jgi:hypothetical protein
VAAVLRVAARAEQEIRAYPRVYDGFYRALTRNAVVRRVVGRAKAGVRSRDDPGATGDQAPEAAAVAEARDRTVARRLGLQLPLEPP